MRFRLALLGTLLVSLATAASSQAAACPDAVTGAVNKAYPNGTIASCKHVHEDGHAQYEIKLDRSGGSRLEIDVSPDGKILQTEEKVALDTLPDAVTKAVAHKYPRGKLLAAEKEVHADGAVFYEVKLQAGRVKKEATFSAEGKFVEEE